MITKFNGFNFKKYKRSFETKGIKEHKKVFQNESEK